MPNQGLSGKFQFVEYPINKSLDEQSLKQVLGLFRSYYYSYHYIDKITMSDQYRILCVYKDTVVGYAAVRIKKNCGILSNFLVRKSLQRCGIGTRIEQYRMNFCQNNNLCIYASTDVTTPGSQLLKIKHGLVPINIKYGYRQGVYGENDLSFAVSFISSGYYRPGRRCDLEVNDKLKRIRIISAQKDYIGQCLEKVIHNNEYYIDILVTKELAAGMINNDHYAFLGTECDFNDSKDLCFYYLFQFKNRIFQESFKNYRNEVLSYQDIVNPSYKQVINYRPPDSGHDYEGKYHVPPVYNLRQRKGFYSGNVIPESPNPTHFL